jgi:hypothetical protein
MENKAENSLQGLKFAKLSETQEKELRSLERKFNTEFASAFYFMVVDDPTHGNPS